MGCSASHLDGRQRLQSLSGKFFWLRPLQLHNPCALVDAPSRAINTHSAFDHFIVDPRIPNACFLVQIDVTAEGVRVSSRPFLRKRSEAGNNQGDANQTNNSNNNSSGSGSHDPLSAWKSFHFQCCGTRRFSVLLRQESRLSFSCNTHVELTVRSGAPSTCTLIERHLGAQVVSTNATSATTGQWGFDSADAALASLYDLCVPTDVDAAGAVSPRDGATHRTSACDTVGGDDVGELEDCWATATSVIDAAVQRPEGSRLPRRHAVFGDPYLDLVVVGASGAAGTGESHNFTQLRGTAGELLPIWVASFVGVQSRRCTLFVQSLFPSGTLVVDGTPAVPASRRPSPARERRHRATVNFGMRAPFVSVELPLASFFSARVVFGSYCVSPAHLHDPESNYAVVFKPPVDVLHQLGEPLFPLSLVFDDDV